MSIYKKGATIRILLDQLTDEEFDAIYPYDSVKCEAEIKRSDNSGAEYVFSVEPDIPNKQFMITSVSSDTWPVGEYKLDVRFTRDGEHFFVPQREYIQFKIIAPVTDDSTEVEA